MERFKELTELARIINRDKEVERVARQMDTLIREADTHVVILGGYNSGKTTIINLLLGMEVKEPDMLGQDGEKPLRVTFEKGDEDERYECHVVMNREWHDECVVLYEFKTVDILDEDGYPDEEMNTKDMIFYVISALAPLTGEDVRVIKELGKAMPVQLLINKLDIVDDGSKKKVIRYVEEFCQMHSLSAPIPVEHKSDGAFGKRIRGMLPNVLIRDTLRNRHTDATYRVETEKLVKFFKKELEHAKAADKQAKADFQTEDAKKRMMRSQWKTLQTDMIESNSKTCDYITEKLQESTKKLADMLYASGIKNHFSKDWEQKQLSELVSDAMLKRLNGMCRKIEVFLTRDVNNIMKEAVEKGLVDKLPVDVPVIKVDVADAVSQKPGWREEYPLFYDENSKKILGFTGAVLGLLIISPVPLAFSVAGGTASVIIGGICYLKGKEEWNQEVWRQKLEEYAQANITNLIQVLTNEVKVYCRQILEFLTAKEKEIALEQHPDVGGRELIEELEKALNKCEILLN